MCMKTLKLWAKYKFCVNSILEISSVHYGRYCAYGIFRLRYGLIQFYLESTPYSNAKIGICLNLGRLVTLSESKTLTWPTDKSLADALDQITKCIWAIKQQLPGWSWQKFGNMCDLFLLMIESMMETSSIDTDSYEEVYSVLLDVSEADWLSSIDFHNFISWIKLTLTAFH